LYSQLTNGPGIGLAIAKYLLSAPQQCNVVLVARTKAPLEELKEQYGDQVQVVTGDVTGRSIAQTAITRALQSFGQIDGIVLNHGALGPISQIADCDPEEWKSGFDVNFISMLAFVSIRHHKLRKEEKAEKD
jgi:NADP-dependent 3-hydroxy acid dehydrogenase YdfG